MKQTAFLGLALAALCAQGPALGAEAGDLLREHLYAGTIGAGIEALAPLAEGGDQEAVFGVGVLRFFLGAEHVAQAMYRHGLTAPEATALLGLAMTAPVPVNASPEPLDYATLREILEALVSDMDAAHAILLDAGESGDYVVALDPLRFRIDMDGDGVGGEAETIGLILGGAFGAAPSAPLDDVQAAPAPSKDKGGATETLPVEVTPEEAGMVIGFDRADAIWLAGYSQVFAAQGDFFLAHDFSETVNATFHRLFPQAGLPMQEAASGGSLMMDPLTDSAIADAVAFIHTLNWPVTDAARLAGVLERFTAITALSRRNWQAILAETDDDREYIPSPRQTPAVPGGEVTEEMVAAWHDTLDKADLILAGDLLVPHWRFNQGFDLAAYFTSATRTDLVMILTGFGALPFIHEGPIASAEDFAAANAVFGADLLGYAFWFN